MLYRETITSLVEHEHKFAKQSGGRGQYGHVYLRIEPQEPGSGYEFVDEIKGGVIPKEYVPAVNKGVQEQMQNGVIAGFPLVDVKVTVYGWAPTMMSTPMKMAFKNCCFNVHQGGC